MVVTKRGTGSLILEINECKMQKKTFFCATPTSFDKLFHGAVYFVYPDKIRKPLLVIEPNLRFVLFDTL